jgi:XRE family transcriptional regulator, regulator of sulfur utilization
MTDRRAANKGSREPPRVGVALAALRASRTLSMDALSRQSGVSKSMLSQIERGRANPTVAVVWRLANALGVPLVELLGEAAAGQSGAIQALHVQDVPVMRSRDGRCTLRVLSPVELAGRVEWYQLDCDPGGVLDSKPHAAGAREHLTVIAGSIEAVSGSEQARGSTGDTLRYRADRPHRLRNVGRPKAVALLVVEFDSTRT